jgi:hypothetical protein
LSNDEGAVARLTFWLAEGVEEGPLPPGPAG